MATSSNLRSKVLRLASNPKPESMLKLIAHVKKNKYARKELADNIAVDAGEWMLQIAYCRLDIGDSLWVHKFQAFCFHL